MGVSKSILRFVYSFWKSVLKSVLLVCFTSVPKSVFRKCVNKCFINVLKGVFKKNFKGCFKRGVFYKCLEVCSRVFNKAFCKVF